MKSSGRVFVEKTHFNAKAAPEELHAGATRSSVNVLAKSPTPFRNIIPTTIELLIRGPELARNKIFSKAELPRAKPGKSAIQSSEINPVTGLVIVHPERLIVPYFDEVSQDKLDGLQKIFDDIKQELKKKKSIPYKFVISEDMDLIIGKSKLWIDGQENKLGHVTLIGGKEPKARMAGVLFGEVNSEGEIVFYIDNDSGRYSEYPDRNEDQLKRVAQRFAELGFPVKVKWIEKKWCGGKSPESGFNSQNS